MREQKYEKVYIRVTADFDTDGNIIPTAFIWRDGKTYHIDRILDVKPRPAMKAGGHGNRYTVRINGKERYIFLETPTHPEDGLLRWFVEAPAIA